ncbi:hypothetical protein [Herbidospora mongoliensis]|uniref:hypothetical protein n=1 Tax=Herbidospora mongoliensis TaxID=688067 RepID=UPI0008325FF1|nr:hypothetical protein [Herbidospora mongoliensis]
MPPLTAFEEFSDNLDSAQRLMSTGESLGALGAASIRDVADLYRAAWSQAVAGLDHWIAREIADRAVALALDPGLPRPRGYLRLDIPMELFEQVHLRGADLREALTAHWRERFARVTYQRPDAIGDGLAQVVDGDLWPRVAAEMTAAGRAVTPGQVRERLHGIVDRRDRIAHSADRSASPEPGRTPLSAADTRAAIAWLRELGTAVLAVLGGPIATAAPAVPKAPVAPAVAPAAGRARSAKPFWRSALERRLYKFALEEGFELLEATDEVLYLYGEDRKSVLCLDREQASKGAVVVALPPTTDPSGFDADPELTIDREGRNANFDAFLGDMAPKGFLIVTCGGKDAFQRLLKTV